MIEDFNALATVDPLRRCPSSFFDAMFGGHAGVRTVDGKYYCVGDGTSALLRADSRELARTTSWLARLDANSPQLGHLPTDKSHGWKRENYSDKTSYEKG